MSQVNVLLHYEKKHFEATFSNSKFHPEKALHSYHFKKYSNTSRMKMMYLSNLFEIFINTHQPINENICHKDISNISAEINNNLYFTFFWFLNLHPTYKR